VDPHLALKKSRVKKKQIGGEGGRKGSLVKEEKKTFVSLSRKKGGEQGPLGKVHLRSNDGNRALVFKIHRKERRRRKGVET